MIAPLPDLILLPLVENALLEDLGHAGDITTDAIIPPNAKCRAELNVRKAGVVAGLDMARLAFHAIDPAVAFKQLKADGERVKKGETLAVIEGKARSVLSAERVALNFLCHLSGIASEVHKFVEEIKPHKAKISCTRKTTPGLRTIEKYAVRAGGGSNHRFGLYDAVLIKDNHIAAAGGIKPALERAHNGVGHLVKIEIEVDTLQQLDEALELLPILPFDAVLLDNMRPSMLRRAVKKVDGRVVVEASGGVTLETVADIAATGVDVISSGALTHSAPILDIGLDFLD